MTTIIAETKDVLTIVNLPGPLESVLDDLPPAVKNEIIDEIQRMAQVQALTLNGVLLSPQLSPLFCHLLRGMAAMMKEELDHPSEGIVGVDAP